MEYLKSWYRSGGDEVIFGIALEKMCLFDS